MKMINLLPPKEKKFLVQEEKWRLILVLETVFMAALISLALILFSIKTYISGQVEVQKIILSQKALETPQMEEVEERIKESNLIFSNLHSFYEESLQTTEILEKISRIPPPGIYFNNLTLTPGKGDYLGQMSISGFSSDREILIEFKKELEEQAAFKDIVFPPFCWLKPIDINFSVTFKISK